MHMYDLLFLVCTVPPGDEAWLCPGCVCKLDCFVLLNDLLGTHLSLADRWEVRLSSSLDNGIMPGFDFYCQLLIKLFWCA